MMNMFLNLVQGMRHQRTFLGCAAIKIQWVLRFESTRVESIRELRAVDSACPATIKAIYFPLLQIRALCS